MFGKFLVYTISLYCILKEVVSVGKLTRKEELETFCNGQKSNGNLAAWKEEYKKIKKIITVDHAENTLTVYQTRFAG